MAKHSVTVRHEIHNGAQRFVRCECECGWKAPWIPLKLRARLPICTRVSPFGLTAEQKKLRAFYGVR